MATGGRGIPEADATAFARYVWQQGRSGVGVPVLLFTDATLAVADRPGDADPEPIGLFTPEAYVRQGALAATALPGLGPPAPTPTAGPTTARDPIATGGSIATSAAPAGGPTQTASPGATGAPAGAGGSPEGSRPWTSAHSAALLAAPVLALNFHGVPPGDRATVRRQLEQVAEFGPSLDPDAQDAGRQVLVAFYDGFRDVGLWGAQVCAELGLRAYFFPVFSHPAGGPTELLTDRDLEQIGAVHTVGFHSATHRRAVEVGPDDLRREVLDPLEAIAAATGRPVTVAAWRRGTRFDPGLPADRVLRERGIRHLVSNWSVEAVPPDRD